MLKIPVLQLNLNRTKVFIFVFENKINLFSSGSWRVTTRMINNLIKRYIEGKNNLFKLQDNFVFSFADCKRITAGPPINILLQTRWENPLFLKRGLGSTKIRYMKGKESHSRRHVKKNCWQYFLFYQMRKTCNIK